MSGKTANRLTAATIALLGIGVLVDLVLRGNAVLAKARGLRRG